MNAPNVPLTGLFQLLWLTAPSEGTLTSPICSYFPSANPRCKGSPLCWWSNSITMLSVPLIGQCRWNALSVYTAIQILVFQKLNKKQNAQQKEIKAIYNNPETRCPPSPNRRYLETDDTWILGNRRYLEWNWTKYFFGHHETEGCLIFHALLSLRHKKKRRL